jgi:hypothetical protein
MDVLGVMAHYIDDDYTHQNILLSLAPTGGSHTGENLAERLIEVIKDFRIGSSIGYYIADNAPNNDTAIGLLGDHLQVDVYRQRLRCAAHIINLSCKAMLLGVDADCFEDLCDVPASTDLEDFDDIDLAIDNFAQSALNERTAIMAWRRKGPVGKLHNLVVHVKGSPARRRLFEDKQRHLNTSLPVYKLVTNGGVRWNSTFDMIERALKLKDALELYQSHYRYDPVNPTSEDALTPGDWMELARLRELLKPFKTASTDIQGNGARGGQGALWQNLSAIDYLMTHLERQKDLLRHQPASHFKACVNLGWKKLDKYYSLTDRSPAYRAAIYCNPQLKRSWFERHWGDQHASWVKEVDQLMCNLVSSYQKRYPNDQPVVAMRRHQTELNDFQRYNTPASNNYNASELERYNVEPLIDKDVDIIKWWGDNRMRYPILARIALDVLAAPATTAADERVFSEADDVINSDRERLAEDTAEAIQTTRSWILAGLVDLRCAGDIPLSQCQTTN